MANFVKLSDVTDWVNEYPDEGVSQLRHALSIGTFGDVNASMAVLGLKSTTASSESAPNRRCVGMRGDQQTLHGGQRGALSSR